MIARLRAALLRLPRLLCGLLAVGYAFCIFTLSSRSLPSVEVPWFSYFTNLAHAPLFGGLAVLVGLALWPRHAVDDQLRRRVLGAWCATVGYAIVDEIHQAFTPGRAPSVADVMTDAFGAALALVMLRHVLAPEIKPRPWHYASLVAAILLASLLAYMEPS